MSYDNNTLMIMVLAMMIVPIALCTLDRIKWYSRMKFYGFKNSAKVITASIVAAFTLSACSSNPTLVDRISEQNERNAERNAEMIASSIDNVPDWFLAPPISTLDVVYTTGTGRSNNMAMARNKAILAAQTQLADHINALVSSHTKQRITETNDDTMMNTDQVVKKLVAEANMAGHMVEKMDVHSEGRHYRFYVLVAYPVGKSNAMLMDQRNQSYMKSMVSNSDERFEELNREIREHRQ
jgi:hypothetical protein